jgi:hypothetical protein
MARSFSAIMAALDVCFAAFFIVAFSPSLQDRQFFVNLQRSFPHHLFIGKRTL